MRHQSSKEECAICLEEVDSKRAPLTCGHWVHRHCAVASDRQECPICRHPIILTRSEVKSRRERERLQGEDDDDLTEDEANAYLLLTIEHHYPSSLSILQSLLNLFIS